MKKFFFVLVFSSLLFSLNEVRAYTSSDVSNAQFLANQWIIVKQSTTAGYRLDNTITRAEVIGMALKIKWITLPNNYICKNYFIDAPYNPSNNWICRAVELAADNGIITRGNTKARPQDSITRAEALAMLVWKFEAEWRDYPYSFDTTISWQRFLLWHAVEKGIVDLSKLQKTSPSEPWMISAIYHFYPNRSATRTEVFGFARNILWPDTYIKVTTKYVEAPDLNNPERESWNYGPFKDGTYDCTVTFPRQSNFYTFISNELSFNYPLIPVLHYGLIGFTEVTEMQGGFETTYIPLSNWIMVVMYSRIGLQNECFWNIEVKQNLVDADVLRVYYHNLNTWYRNAAYNMRSPAWVSLETFQSWYEKVTKVNFQENTLKDLWDNTYEFLVDMTESGVKTTYKVKSKVDLANFKINNISSVKQ